MKFTQSVIDRERCNKTIKSASIGLDFRWKQMRSVKITLGRHPVASISSATRILLSGRNPKRAEVRIFGKVSGIEIGRARYVETDMAQIKEYALGDAFGGHFNPSLTFSRKEWNK